MLDKKVVPRLALATAMLLVALALLAASIRAATPWPRLADPSRAAIPARGAVASPPMRATATARTRHPDITPAAREIEQLAGLVVAQRQLPGLALAIVQDDRVISLRGYGVTDTKGGEPVTPDTVFRLASLSKAFAATLSSQLVQEEAMGWDRPIIEQLPAFKLRDFRRSQQVTVRDVLSHKVGVARNMYDRDLEANAPYPLLAERLSVAPMSCNTGDCYAYQNVAFSLIGDLVFAATGDFYPHQVETRIFHPLGMTSSTFGREGLEGSPSWARPHVRARGGWVSVRPKETYYHVPPAAGVNASVRDMSAWLMAQMGQRPDVLPPEVLNPIHTPQVLSPGEMRGTSCADMRASGGSRCSWRRERLRAAYYGMGWRVFDYSGHTLLFHGGAVQGYRALIGILPDRGVGIVVLWNSESAAPTGLMPTLLDRVLGLPREDWVGVDDSIEE
jgi:beta-lactamase class C